VTARQRWQALQFELTAAKAAAERGDRTRAIEALDRALALDPEFLAARALRERLMAAPPPARRFASSIPTRRPSPSSTPRSTPRRRRGIRAVWVRPPSRP